MSWRPIDFQGIIGLDTSLIHQIDRYLQEKETRLALQILNSLTIESAKPSLSPGPDQFLKMSDAVEGFTKKIRQLTPRQDEASQTAGKNLVKDLNTTLWEFTEVLEGCVVELFEQIKQVRIDQWDRNLVDVVQSIKEMLVHHIDDLMWTIQRLEKPVSEYFEKLGIKGSFFSKWLGNDQTQLDPALLKNLKQTEEYLKSQYGDFIKRYEEYQRLHVKVDESLDKMKKFPILALLDLHDQNLYVDLYRLLKLLELNPHPRGALAQDTKRSLKLLAGIHCVVRIFKSYFHGLKDALFKSSLELKSLSSDGENKGEMTKKLQSKVKEYAKELRHLLATMTRYREFTLTTDPNPYVRSRWGFTEWTVSPEPPKTKMLLNLIYRGEEVKRWYDSFLEALKKDPLAQERKETKAHEEIERILHEMGQPLISKSMMKRRAEELLNYIKECDEVSSPHPETIAYVEGVFSRALRADWKYHVLHEFPLFHELYRIHQGLEEQVDDPAHAFRLDRFDELFEHVDKWLRKGDVYSHIHEIELDINDMKACLQDFLASIQRGSRERKSDPFWDETVHKFKQQLLEYRYVFGRFFSEMMLRSFEGQQLRNQFLFVDQYFETIENLLNER